MPGSKSTVSDDHEEETGEREFRANGNSMKTAEVEAKLDEGNIQEAESSLREGLSLNFEVHCLPFYLFNDFVVYLVEEFMFM